MSRLHHLADWILRQRELLSGGAQRFDTPLGVRTRRRVPLGDEPLRPGGPARRRCLLFTEEPGDEGTQGEALGVLALTFLVAIRDPLEVLECRDSVLTEGADRRQQVGLRPVLGEEDLQQRFGLVALASARRGEPVGEHSAPRLGDRVDRASPPTVPLLARLGEAGGDEALRLCVHVALRTWPQVVEREPHLPRELVSRVVA